MWRLNGEDGALVAVTDRGLSYGDGVFRTIKVKHGQPLFWAAHFQKLCADAARLALVCPDETLWLADCEALIASHGDGVLKLVLTRGASGRGYRMPVLAEPTRLVMWSPLPDYPAEFALKGVALRLCSLRLSQQPLLAGIKHLNRLENVLARAEWDDPAYIEGVLLDQLGHVVEGVMSNFFWRVGDVWETPCLDESGVAGVMRAWVIHHLKQAHASVNEVKVGVERLQEAEEFFICNSLIGVWPVASFEGKHWSSFAMALHLQQCLQHEEASAR